LIIEINPLSVNQCWQGKRFKTPQYKSYERELLLKLKPKTFDFEKLSIEIEFGFSSKLKDIDNPLKPLLDILQKKYGFDDRNIFKLVVEKRIVTKGKEFIKINISDYEH
jgi:Holliday junction resolvase RusA-like endonuclease